MDLDKSIYVAGHRGLVGSACCRRLSALGATRLITRDRAALDLRDQAAVDAFFAGARPAYVILAAATVGGISANSAFAGDFIRDNLQIQTNVIDAARRNGCEKLLFLGSSCIYPKHCPQPIREEYLLGGPLEPTNEGYAVAKIAGIKMCQAYRRQYGFDAISVMPTNLYGIGDNFHPENSHVLPALIRRFHEAARTGAPKAAVWGTGAPRREFLFADDLAEALLFLMDRYAEEAPINVGCGRDIGILELAELVAKTVGFKGRVVTDPSRPDGTPRKLLDVSRINALGWKASTSLADGLEATYAWYRAHQKQQF
ncbi:MAG: GDP-L-fucose synthase [Desulfovibrio sp.]|jgi:GDP-L-fucose synthase|nr:GDP-L-fucose synthase [Desulfovibrio sp.]